MAGRKPTSAAVGRSDFAALLAEVKGRIQAAQTRAVLAVNAELVRLYWDIGRIILERQGRAGWGAAIIPRLARELRNELPEIKGFSERNIKLMAQFAGEYRHAFEAPDSIGQPPVAQLTGDPKGQLPVAQVPWAHNVLLMQKVKDLPTRRWYMEQTLANGWSRNVLGLQIDARAHARHGKAVSNFAALLPAPQSDLAQQALKDPYIFDFLTLTEPFQERELETELVRHLEKFLLELGQGFSFVGRQYRLDVGDDDFYIDLLFYHLRLRAFVVIDLKKGKFKPEYAGKLNFYCNVVNDRLRHATDAQTIGLIFCQTYVLLAEQSAFLRFASGTTHQTIYFPEVKAFHICLPPLPEQRAIAHILGTLDDKIELNRRMNETLEAMARALFKSWFVDFDPVRAKAEGRNPGLPKPLADLFPARLVDSELGEIPEGWEVTKLGELLELAYGKALKAENRRDGNIPVYGSNGQVGWHDERLVPGPGIVVGRKGNPGIATWVPTDFFPIDTTFYVVPKSNCQSLTFLFHVLRTHDLASLGADSAVPGLNRNLAYMSSQVLPTAPLLAEFERIASSLSHGLILASDESLTLTALRDTLLPKLISGELRIKDADRFVPLTA